MPPLIRPAGPEDAAAIAAIYRPAVVDSAISFEIEAPDAAEMARRIAAVSATHLWLVAEQAGAVLAYAYASRYRDRPAYRWTVETAIYVAEAARGRHIGAPLYRALLERLTARGFVTAIAEMTAGNAASAALHRRLGFAQVGTWAGVGFKHNAWHDVIIWQRDLAPRSLQPVEPMLPTA